MIIAAYYEYMDSEQDLYEIEIYNCSHVGVTTSRNCPHGENRYLSIEDALESIEAVARHLIHDYHDQPLATSLYFHLLDPDMEWEPDEGSNFYVSFDLRGWNIEESLCDHILAL